MLFAPISIPEPVRKTYTFLRVLLWFGMLFGAVLLALAFLFPNFSSSFNFKTPGSSRNTLVDPRLSNGTPRPNGRLGTDESLTIDAGAFGDFSIARVTADLEKKSGLPESFTATLRRSYRAFLLPTGSALDTFPREDLLVSDGTYYVLRNETLTPFVSTTAYLSRYPADFARSVPPEYLERYHLAVDYIGFRVGSLISFGDGVYVVTSETDIRPVGSADIFLNLGYDFKNVIPASEEDLGIYKRGRILIMGALHPTGTLFEDEDTGTLYMIEGSTKRPVTDPDYRNFLLTKQTPIRASQSKGETTVSCSLASTFFSRTFSCVLPLDTLAQNPGSNYELTLSNPDTDIDINTLTLSLETRKNSHNVLTFLSQIKNRILTRFGGR